MPFNVLRFGMFPAFILIIALLLAFSIERFASFDGGEQG